MKMLSVATRIHGRVLVREAPDPSVVVVGFHGYMENADIQMDRLVSLPGSDRWTLVSGQGLHRFYRGRSEEVVAGWMTRQDRDDMISDNIDYVDRIVEMVAAPGARMIMAGFSQGVAMAFRGAVRGRRRAEGVIAVGGDIPPELLTDAACEFPATLLMRGERDQWYSAAKLEADVTALRERGVSARSLVYAAAHEWTPDVSAAASTFIAGGY